MTDTPEMYEISEMEARALLAEEERDELRIKVNRVHDLIDGAEDVDQKYVRTSQVRQALER